MNINWSDDYHLWLDSKYRKGGAVVEFGLKSNDIGKAHQDMSVKLIQRVRHSLSRHNSDFGVSQGMPEHLKYVTF